jgi:Zn-dependent protease
VNSRKAFVYQDLQFIYTSSETLLEWGGERRLRTCILLESKTHPMLPRHIDIVDLVFKGIAFLFAISIHESAHAWMANRCGDPTARMLGRVSLNPIKHIDPVGTLLLPAIGLLAGGFVFGWAKPTPVDPRNFRNPMRDDILTSVAGPVSNFVVVGGALVLMLLIAVSSPQGGQLVRSAPMAAAFGVEPQSSGSFLVPATTFLYDVIFINVILAVFNLIPVPPLDGSHVLRHFLSDSVRRVYDSMGWYALIALVVLGGGLLSRLISPFMHAVNSVLMSL